jgi:Mce-associated membrane protein
MSGRVRAVAAGAVLALLASGGFLLSHLSDGRTIDNLAFVDAATTSRVTSDVSEAVQSAFTLDPRNPAAARRAAHRWLTGNAVGEYDDLYGPLLSSAREDGLSLTTTIRAAGLTWLHADEAQLLVMADQTGRTTAGQSRSGAAQLSVTAVLVDGRWLVTDFTLL